MNHRTITAFLAVTACCGVALAQEAMYTQAATMPAPGNAIIREQIHFFKYGQNPVTGEKQEDLYVLDNSLSVGLARALAVTITVPVVVKETTLATGDGEWDYGGEGPDDALAFNSAYVYRIDPPAYTADSQGAWYVTAEINGLYETSGDVELRWSPGLMYEGRRFGFEVMAQFPLWNDLSERAELDLGLGMGVRLLF